MPELVFQYQTPQKMIGTFVVDAFLSEHYQFSNSVTEVPVEEGSNIADHIVEDHDVISIEAFIGNTAFEVIITDGNSISNLQAPDKMARIRQAYFELKKITKEKKTVNVVLGLETFSGMAITSFTIDRDVETGANLPFSMEFRKIRVVKSDTTQINAATAGAGAGGGGTNQTAADQASNTTEQGNSATEQPTNSQSKEEWRRQIRAGGPAKPADYQREFGVPYPQ